MHRQRSWLVAAVLGLLSSACRQPPPERSLSLVAATTRQHASATPAVWRYHPQKAGTIRAARSIGASKTLFVGTGGQRWLADVNNGTLTAAARLAPEDLVAVLQTKDSPWLFLGRSGATYGSNSPLAPFTHSQAPPDALEAVTAGDRSVLGVRFDGALLRSPDAGRTWARRGSEDAFFVSVALTSSGRGCALAIPERLYVTRDGGHSWQATQTDPVGAVEVTAFGEDITVAGALGFFELDLESEPKLIPTQKKQSRAEYELPLPLPLGPDAEALAAGRATLDAERYFELRPLKVEGSPLRWQKVSGSIDSLLKATPIKTLDGCRAVRVATFSGQHHIACFRVTPKGSAAPFNLYELSDDGSLRKRTPTLRGDPRKLVMAAGPNGRLLLAGICTPHDEPKGCQPYGIFRLEKKQQKPRASVAAGLKQLPFSLTFSRDGKYAYAVGRHGKSVGPTLFVSSDGGSSFQAKVLDEAVARRLLKRLQGALRGDPTANVSLTAGDSGQLALVLTQGGEASLLTTDETGELLSVSDGPGDRVNIASNGAQAIAFSAAEAGAWESLDGGVSWNRIGSLPQAVCKKNDRSCQARAFCSIAGCVVGSLLTRVGWQGQADLSKGVLPPPEGQREGLLSPKVKSTVSCTLSETDWYFLEGVKRPPGAADAAINKTLWHAPGVDPRARSLWTYHARIDNKEKVVRTELFSKVNAPGRYAFAIFDQVEGVAALRYLVPRPEFREHELSGIELSWDNRFEDRVWHARVNERIPARPGDYTQVAGGLQLAQPSLVSIASGGIYLRVHRAAQDAQETLFLDGARTERIPPVVWPSSILKEARSEMAHVDDRHHPLRIAQGGAVLTRATYVNGAWSFHAATLGLPDPELLGFQQASGITYVGGDSALYILRAAPGGWPRSGKVFPIQGRGNPARTSLAVAQQLDLADPPQPCTPSEREQSPRIVAAMQPGTRHPVIVTDGLEPIRTLLTRHAVLHGTPDTPCAAALSADPIDMRHREDRVWMHALFTPDLESAWAFRVTFDDEGDSSVEARPMRCSYDPAAAVPEEVFDEPGTRATPP